MSSREIISDARDELMEAERLRIADINRLAIAQVFENITFSPNGVGTISFVNVSTSIVTGTQTGT